MLVSTLEREKNPTDAFVEYKSKIVAGLMILFFSSENNHLAFLVSAGLAPSSTLVICSPLHLE